MSVLLKSMRIFIVTAMIFVTVNVAKAEDTAKATEAAQMTPSKDAVLKTVHDWLQLVDQEKYADSWDGASEHFQRALTQEDWLHSLNAVRKPMGQVKSRQVKASEFMAELPGAPDGKYIVVIYETVFQNKQHGIETVTFTQEGDNQWRIAGYFIK
ncbi:MAG: DUF4019 domain-containing protein [Alphaproteobacteria bacterium]|nr:MAG: DUF4019 domain-containing protein [Alphaproteobacteria bacterium]